MRRFLFSLIILLFGSSVSNAEQGQFNLGLEAGFSPIELEAEETAQKIANASGSTVTTEYDYGVLVGRIFAEYGITSELTGEIGYFNTTSADATYTISTDSASESYEASGFDISARLDFGDFFAKAGMHSSTLEGAMDVTIGGTTYSATGEAQGTGTLFGGGMEVGNTLISISRYNDIGGIDTDLTFFSIGFKVQ